jgi:hypothetical protein
MCFSASASFGASAVLLVGGIIALKKVKDPSQKAFAAIPLIFSIQQLSEGFLWLSFTHESFAFMHQLTSYFFLLIAQVIWPTWVVLSVWFMETNTKRRKILAVLLIIGILDSLFLAFCLFYFKVDSVIKGHHIFYNLHSRQDYIFYSGLVYLMVTVVPLLISSVPRVYILGLIIAVSAAFSRFYFHDFFISVWCFFAATISLYIIYILSYPKVKIKEVFNG